MSLISGQGKYPLCPDYLQRVKDSSSTPRTAKVTQKEGNEASATAEKDPREQGHMYILYTTLSLGIQH